MFSMVNETAVAMQSCVVQLADHDPWFYFQKRRNSRRRADGVNVRHEIHVLAE